MNIFDNDLPEKGWFNLVLMTVVVVVVAYLGYLNFNQYNTITQLKKEICDKECVKKMLTESVSSQAIKKIDQFERPVAAMDTADVQILVTPTVSTKRKSTVASDTKPYESYKTMSGGTVSSVAWKQLNEEQFGLDISLYPDGVTVTMEGWVELNTGANKAYVRLYDLTNNRVVDGSEVTVQTKGRASFYSGPLSIWRGSNQYRIEAKTDTGYQVSVDSVRLKIKKP